MLSKLEDQIESDKNWLGTRKSKYQDTNGKRSSIVLSSRFLKISEISNLDWVRSHQSLLHKSGLKCWIDLVSPIFGNWLCLKKNLSDFSPGKCKCFLLLPPGYDKPFSVQQGISPKLNHDWSESPGFHIGWALWQSGVCKDKCQSLKCWNLSTTYLKSVTTYWRKCLTSVQTRDHDMLDVRHFSCMINSIS